MDIFNLPPTAKVNRVIPKTTFDAYTSKKQKKMFSDLVSRITWLYKLSTETINLEANEIQEIQVFKIELKIKEDIRPILDIIDKAIPYHIVFALEINSEVYLSTAIKHAHPINESNAIIDWRLDSPWFLPPKNKYTFSLKRSIDAVFQDFCFQLSEEKWASTMSLQDLVGRKKQIAALEKEIAKLKAGILNCKQFNLKVEMNLNLREAKERLKLVLNA